MSQALIFSIEEFSVYDGPGIRTTVFTMGCPLRCEWCHSPEGQGFENFIMRAPNGCRNCGNCLQYALHLPNNENRIVYTEDSIKHCPENLLRYCARTYTPQELYQKLEKNFHILKQNGGGITFSGGEPTANPDFLLDSLKLMEEKVHRAVQTCGACSPELFSKVLDNCDYILFDIKLFDNDLHQKYTGASNVNILQNFKLLVNSRKDFVIRTPLIPCVTDTEDNITKIAQLLSEMNIHYIELLPYNKLTGAKYPLAGKNYCPSFDTQTPVQYRTEIFNQYGIKTKIL